MEVHFKGAAKKKPRHNAGFLMLGVKTLLIGA
jgi:hypothetical protein